MSTYAKIAADAGDQYLAAIAQTQEAYLNAVAASMTWAPPVAAAPIGDFPTPQEIVGVSFGFAQKLLKQQQDFAQKLIAANATATREEPTSPRSAVSPKSKSASAN